MMLTMRLLTAGTTLQAVAVPAAVAGVVAVGVVAIRDSMRDVAMPAPAADMRADLRAYLLENPDIVLEALQALQARRIRDDQARERHLVSTLASELYSHPGDPIGGNPAGSVPMAVFTDYRCPYCRQLMPVLDELLRREPELRIVYKELPVLGPASQKAARLALASNQLGRYGDTQRQLFAGKEPDLVSEMQIVGATIDEGAITAALQANLALAQRLEIKGTPTIVVGNVIIRGAGSLERLERAIAEARSAGRS